MTVRSSSSSDSEWASIAAHGAGATPSSNWPTPSCALRHRSPRCLPSASNRCSAALTAASTRHSSVAASTRIDSASCSSSTDQSAGRSSLPSMPRLGTVATPNAAPNEASTTRPRNTRPDSPSWRAGTTSGSASWTGPMTRGRLHSTWRASRRLKTPPWPPPTQIRRLVGLLPGDGEVPLFVFDAGYNPIAIGHDLAEERCECLTRIRDDRVFYADPPPRPNRPARSGGRPPRHGCRFKCSDRRTQNKPDECLKASDPRYGNVRVDAWHGLHPRVIGRGRWADYGGAPPIVRGSVIRVDVERLPKPTSRDEEDAVAVLVRRWRARSRPMLACLSAALRHRAHLPLPQEHPGLDHAVTVHARAGRPLELADRRRLHPTPSWTWSRR